MIDRPEIVDTEEQIAAVIRLKIRREEMPQVFGQAIQELMSTLEAQAMEPVGPVFAHHLSMDPEWFDLEAGLPTPAPVEPHGRVRPGALPATTVARTVYHGPYQGLPDAWREFTDWMNQAGWDPGASLWERYLVGPESEPEAGRWRTELNRVLLD